MVCHSKTHHKYVTVKLLRLQFGNLISFEELYHQLLLRSCIPSDLLIQRLVNSIQFISLTKTDSKKTTKINHNSEYNLMTTQQSKLCISSFNLDSASLSYSLVPILFPTFVSFKKQQIFNDVNLMFILSTQYGLCYQVKYTVHFVLIQNLLNLSLSVAICVCALIHVHAHIRYTIYACALHK